MSLYSINNPSKIFSEAFGKPWYDKNRKAWCYYVPDIPTNYANRLYLNKQNRHFYYTISFEGNSHMLNALSPIAYKGSQAEKITAVLRAYLRCTAFFMVKA